MLSHAAPRGNSSNDISVGGLFLAAFFQTQAMPCVGGSRACTLGLAAPFWDVRPGAKASREVPTHPDSRFYEMCVGSYGQHVLQQQVKGLFNKCPSAPGWKGHFSPGCPEKKPQVRWGACSCHNGANRGCHTHLVLERIRDAVPRRRQKKDLDIRVLNGGGAVEHYCLRLPPGKIAWSKVAMLGAGVPEDMRPLCARAAVHEGWESDAQLASPDHFGAPYEVRPKSSGALSWSEL